MVYLLAAPDDSKQRRMWGHHAVHAEDGIARLKTESTLAVPGYRGRSVADYPIAKASMYGVPSDLDLSHFRSGTCIQIAIGEFQIQFYVHPLGSISVEGRWELRNPGGQTIDQSLEPSDRDSYRVHRIIGKSVVTTFVNAPK